MLNEVRARDDIILFIDELHTLVGAGAAEGAIDAASMLKPLLARGELQTIGATTLDEYRKHLEKDAALARRFQPVKVPEPSVADTIEILKGLREGYEAYHGVTITDQAVVAAANLADHYIPDRFLPDKAIDLIDEAGARLRVRRMAMPLDYQAIEDEMARVRVDKKLAVECQDFEQAKRLNEKEEELLQRQATEEQKWRAEGVEIFDVVDEEVIAEVLADWTGIPVSKLTEEETAKLLRYGRGAPQAGHRPGRRSGGRCPGGQAHAGGVEGPQAPERVVHLPRALGCGQDRDGQGVGRVPLRGRVRIGPARHVRVHGPAHREPASRFSSGLRRI